MEQQQQQQQQQPTEQEKIDQYIKNIATRICEFMKKSAMIGEENPDYAECWNFLNAVFAGELSVLPTPELQGLRESDKEIAIMQECITRWPGSVGKRVDQVRLERDKDR